MKSFYLFKSVLVFITLGLRPTLAPNPYPVRILYSAYTYNRTDANRTHDLRSR